MRRGRSENWRLAYNTARPPGGLAGRTPSEYAEQFNRKYQTQLTFHEEILTPVNVSFGGHHAYNSGVAMFRGCTPTPRGSLIEDLR